MNIKPVHGIAIGILAFAAWLAASLLWGASLLYALVLLIPGRAAAVIIWFRTTTIQHTAGILVAAALVFGALWIPDSTIVALSILLPRTLQDPIAWMLFLTLAGMLSVATLLLSIIFTLSAREQVGRPYAMGDSTPADPHTTWLFRATVVLSVLTLAKVFSNLYWFMVWDTTIDPLGILWLIVLIPPIVCVAGVLLLLLPGKFKWAGAAYLLFIPLLIVISIFAWRVDFHQLTAQRADQVKRAVETYHAQQGRYPDTLQQLVPQYTLSFAGPVILYGQDWCYQGASDYYRLGYLDREHWSSPILFGHVHSASGIPPQSSDVCRIAFDAYRAQHPEWDQVLRFYTKPSPTP